MTTMCFSGSLSWSRNDSNHGHCSAAPDGYAESVSDVLDAQDTHQAPANFPGVHTLPVQLLVLRTCATIKPHNHHSLRTSRTYFTSRCAISENLHHLDNSQTLPKTRELPSVSSCTTAAISAIPAILCQNLGPIRSLTSTLFCSRSYHLRLLPGGHWSRSQCSSGLCFRHKLFG